MNNKNTEITETLIGALNELKKTTKKAREKKETKRFQEISHPITLQEGLSRLTKDELHFIRKRYDIKRASSLNKAELLALLEKKIPELLIECCMVLDEKRHELIKKMADNDGIISLPNLEDYQLNYWLKSGIIFTGQFDGEKVLVMPQEILHRFTHLNNKNELTKTIRKNTEWIKLTQGLLYYYGTLSVSQIFDFLENKYLNENIELFKFFMIMHDAADYYKNIRMDDNWSNFRVFNGKRVVEEHQKRKDLTYYPFNKKQLIKAGEANYVEKNKSYHALVDFIFENFEIKKEKADSLVKECVYATQSGGSPPSILTFLQNSLQFQSTDTLKKLSEKVINLINHTREWFLKGHNSEELIMIENKSFKSLPDKKKKIGRNEPCSCGSNKKHKKCCGR